MFEVEESTGLGELMDRVNWRNKRGKLKMMFRFLAWPSG